jgi:hypothetical protein
LFFLRSFSSSQILPCSTSGPFLPSTFFHFILPVLFFQSYPIPSFRFILPVISLRDLSCIFSVLPFLFLYIAPYLFLIFLKKFGDFLSPVFNIFYPFIFFFF